MAIKIISFSIKVIFLKNLYIINSKTLYFLLLKSKAKIKSSIEIRKNIDNN